jgi:hypothetical protein
METPYYGCFADYDDEYLRRRIAYWEDPKADDFSGVLPLLYAERDLRVERQLLAWIEQK